MNRKEKCIHAKKAETRAAYEDNERHRHKKKSTTTHTGKFLNSAICLKLHKKYNIILRTRTNSLNLKAKKLHISTYVHGFSLDYQIAIVFEIGTSKWSRDVIMDKVKAWLTKMHIELGDVIGEPIAMMCYYKYTTWSGMIKIHLKSFKKMEVHSFKNLELSG